jgi:hypothetical protein
LIQAQLILYEIGREAVQQGAAADRFAHEIAGIFMVLPALAAAELHR